MNREGMNNNWLTAAVLAITWFAAFPALPQRCTAEINSTQTMTERDARIQWWCEARFGMFIHFGLYAIPGRGEWVQWNEQIPVEEYAKLADQFKPDFKPEDWVAVAKAAGMK
jgi:alpha-L-fucosidase